MSVSVIIKTGHILEFFLEKLYRMPMPRTGAGVEQARLLCDKQKEAPLSEDAQHF